MFMDMAREMDAKSSRSHETPFHRKRKINPFTVHPDAPFGRVFIRVAE
jgi:hypothetical protein